MKAWKQSRGVWTCDAFTVRVEVDARTKVILFELYDHTRFVQLFASAQEAMQHAQRIATRPANDVQRKAVAS